MTSVRRVRRGAGAGGAALAVALLLTSCGGADDTRSADDPATASESSSEPAAEPSGEPTETESEDGEEAEPSSPACSDVWVAGQPFPQKYAGCFDDDKQRWVQAMVYRCSSGQHLVTYRRTFYAAKGEKVNETQVPLARDPEFKKALASCGA